VSNNTVLASAVQVPDTSALGATRQSICRFGCVIAFVCVAAQILAGAFLAMRNGVTAPAPSYLNFTLEISFGRLRTLWQDGTTRCLGKSPKSRSCSRAKYARFGQCLKFYPLGFAKTPPWLNVDDRGFQQHQMQNRACPVLSALMSQLLWQAILAVAGQVLRNQSMPLAVCARHQDGITALAACL